MTTSAVAPSAHGSKRSLVIGSVLSAVMTAVPFWLVMNGTLASKGAVIATIFIFAMAQIVVHVSCFLHLNTKNEEGWAMLAFIFTAIIVVLTIVGSVWVMYHLDTNMMPGDQPTAVQ